MDILFATKLDPSAKLDSSVNVVSTQEIQFGHKDPSLARQLHGRPAVSHTTLFQVLLVVFFGSVEG